MGGSSESTSITIHTFIARTKDALFTELDGEAVILSVEKGNYYKLDAIGTHIWQLMKEPRSVAGIVEHLVREYEVSEATCEADVVAFLENLQREGLIDFPETAGPVSGPRVEGE